MIKKYLFGLIEVKLEWDTKTEYTYEWETGTGSETGTGEELVPVPHEVYMWRLVQDPSEGYPQDVELSDVEEGFLKTLSMSPFWWTTLPETPTKLTEFDWDVNETDPESNFTLEYSESPFFERFSAVITSFTARLNTETTQDILEGDTGDDGPGS